MSDLIRSMDELVDRMRDRKEQLDLPNDIIDDIAGLPTRYTAKVFAKMKSPGYISLGPMLGTLGLALKIVEEPAVIDKLKHRFQPRKRKCQRPLSISLSIVTHGQQPTDIAIKTKMAELGRKGGKRRLHTMSARTRRRIAKMAAAARWEKQRKDEVTCSC